MSEDISLPDWGDKKHSMVGNTNRAARFEKAAMALASCIIRNRGSSEEGGGIPVLVEGKRDKKTLRALGFTGPIEKVNRGWDTPRLIAYLHSEYYSRPTPDRYPSVILLMDWDRTGGRIQSSIRERLMAMDCPVDEDLRNVLLRTMKPEGRTVESLLAHAPSLNPLIERILLETD
tara:strand:+ start:263 stop:787 length:525 start_codon:yes stop_codon:yes gene_type:complete